MSRVQLSKSTKGTLYLLLAVGFFGFTHIFDKMAVNRGVDPIAFSLSRVFIGLLVIFLVWWQKHEQKVIRKLSVKDWALFAILGAFSSGLPELISVFALRFTSATNKGIMQGLFTLGTLLLAHVFLKERLPKLFYPSFLVLLFGILLLTSNGLVHPPNTGDWLLFATIPMGSIANVMAKKLMDRFPSFSVTMARYFFATVAIALFLPFIQWQAFLSLGAAVPFVLLSGLFASLRVILFYLGIELKGPTLASAILTLTPVVTALADWFFLAHQFSTMQVLGIVLVVVASLVVVQQKAKYVTVAIEDEA